MQKLLLRPAEAADLIGVGRSKIYAMLAAGELPSIRLGNSLRVPVVALNQWIEERTLGVNESVASAVR